jgi:hypothetical protein
MNGIMALPFLPQAQAEQHISMRAEAPQTQPLLLFLESITQL